MGKLNLHLQVLPLSTYLIQLIFECLAAKMLKAILVLNQLAAASNSSLLTVNDNNIQRCKCPT